MSKNKNAKKLNKFFGIFLAELADLSPRTEETKFAVDRQIQRARKRARIESKGLREKAYQSFLADNAHCRDFVLTAPDDILNDAALFITTVMERFTKRHLEEAIQQPLDLNLLFDHWRFGPGASNGIPWTHTADKIESKMTCTSSCEPLVRRLRSSNPYFSTFDSRNRRSGMEVVRGSKLGCVPKNEDAVRTVAKEPSGNMAFQLAGGWYIAGALSFIGLDITKQEPKNQALALRGSIDGSVATIDLKSASNLIILNLIRRLWPKSWVRFFEQTRSEEIEIPGHGWEELHMLSTMGNGYTFPMMTLTLVALIYGLRCKLYKKSPKLRIDWSSTAVYGDDIIVPTNEYEPLVELLTQSGFVVNTDKSYCDGPFRESCGGDYYKGVDVTPIYVKHLNGDPAIYIAINQVLDFCGKHQLVLHRTILHLVSLLDGGPYLVPEWLNPDQGILTSQCPRKYTYLSLRTEVTALRDEFFAVPLAIGGYITESEPGRLNGRRYPAIPEDYRCKTYTPRDSRSVYRSRRARLPQGYLDGWDPRKRSQAATLHVSVLTDVLVR